MRNVAAVCCFLFVLLLSVTALAAERLAPRLGMAVEDLTEEEE